MFQTVTVYDCQPSFAVRFGIRIVRGYYSDTMAGMD